MESFGQDYLFFKEDKEILNIIGSENIIYSNKIHKISSFSRKQDRNLILTNESIYIFQNKKFKRKMIYQDVKGITFSNISQDFIIHGEKEYDIYISHPDKITIIYIVIKCYENILKKPLIICEVDEKSLKSYVTSKKDKKKDPNHSKMDENKAIDTQTFLIDNDPVEKTKRSHTESIGGKINIIQDILEEFPKRIESEIIYSNEEKIKSIDYRDFKFIKIVGKGNISKVFLAEYKHTKKYYALKSISKDNIENFSSNKSKLKILKNLNHPNLIDINFCYETNDRVYFASPYIQGEELPYHIKTYINYQEEKIKFYAASLLLALEYLHKNEIMYRNLSPRNIIINKDGYIKLNPFHIEKILPIKKEVLEKIEKDEYMAPEVLSDINTEKIKGADWWNLGVIIFEMIYGIPPFYTEDQNKIKDFIMNNELKFPKKPPISESAKDLIINLLNKKCEERLGYNNGFEDIKNHDFFKEFKFDDLLEKKLEAPYKPIVGDILEENKKIEEKYTYEDLLNNGLLYTN